MAKSSVPHPNFWGIALLIGFVFLSAALATYDVADPPSTLTYPSGGVVANACGEFGALIAGYLFLGLGAGAYYVLLSLGVLSALLLAHREIDDPLWRCLGWFISLVGFCTLASVGLPALNPGTDIGAGGYVGAAFGGLFQMHFAAFGSYILIASLIVGGLLLCTDYVLVRAMILAMRGPARAVSVARKVVEQRKTNAKVDVAEEEEEWEEEDEFESEGDAGLTIRMPDEVVVEEEQPEEAEIEERGGKNGSPHVRKNAKGVGGRLVAALGLNRTNKSEREEVEEVFDELDAASCVEDSFDYELPSLDLLLPGHTQYTEEHKRKIRRNAKVLEKTFLSFGFQVKVVEIESGPVISQYEVELEAGLRLSKITGLADDLAIALRVPSVRIVAPIPGKNTVGIEVPNPERQLVRIREVIEQTNSKARQLHIPFYLGKDVSGNPMVVDLCTLPHLLIAGRTGTGKSVCLNSIIISILMSCRPDEVRMLMIDPKMVELSCYKTLPHLMHPVVTDMHKAEAILAWAVEKMEERYALLARAGVRHLSVYNQLGEEELMERLKPASEAEKEVIPRHLPYIVIIADEIADLMMTAAKEVEQHIIRLAQKSRAVGIHLVLATQKPTVDVITGLIKSNLPARISFQVASRTDSRVVLDEMGAERLLGNGDMLFLWPGTSTLLRGQGTYVSDEEINEIVATVGTEEPQFVKELVQLKTTDSNSQTENALSNRDELYTAAVDVAVREGRGSVSLLQRALRIGYGRAARLVDFMAEDGIVGEYNGSQAREILISMEQWEAMKEGGGRPETGQESGSKAVLPVQNPTVSLIPKPANPPEEDTYEEEEEEGLAGDEAYELEEEEEEEEWEEAEEEEDSDDYGEQKAG